MKKYISLIFILFLFIFISVNGLKANESSNNNFELNIGIFFDPTIKDINLELNKIKDNGIKWLRIHFAWKEIEREKGFYNFTLYDHVVSLSKQLGLNILGIIGAGIEDYLPVWLKEEGGIDNENYMNYLEVFAERVIQRYNKDVKIWQLENELNHVSFFKWMGWRKGNWSDLKIREILTILSNITKKYNLTSVVNVIVNNPNWLFFLQNLVEWGINFDVIGIDYYPNYLDDYDIMPGDPNKGIKIYDEINKAKQFNKKIIITEVGYSTYNENHSKENQAVFFEKVIIGSILANITDIFIYRYDDHVLGSDIEANFGLIDYFHNPKLAWYKIKELTSSIYKLSLNLAIKDLKANIKIEGINVTIPKILYFPPVNLNITVEERQKVIRGYNYETIIKFEGISINKNFTNFLKIKIYLNEDTEITFYFSIFLPIFFKIILEDYGIYEGNITFYINNIKVNLENRTLYLKANENYKIIFPGKIKIGDKFFAINPKFQDFMIEFSSHFVMFNISVYYKPVYELKIIIKDWLNFYRSANVIILTDSELILTENIDSQKNLNLVKGNYTVSINYFFLYFTKKINLNNNSFLIFIIPNEIIIFLYSILIFLIILISVFKLKQIDFTYKEIIRSGVMQILIFIILPYYLPLTVSKILFNEYVEIFSLESLLILGIPIIIFNFLRKIKKFSVYFEISMFLSILLYLIFIIGRAYYGNFGTYNLFIFNSSISVNISFFLVMLLFIIILRELIFILSKISLNKNKKILII